MSHLVIPKLVDINIAKTHNICVENIHVLHCMAMCSNRCMYRIKQ